MCSHVSSYNVLTCHSDVRKSTCVVYSLVKKMFVLLYTIIVPVKELQVYSSTVIGKCHYNL